jgi:hypothetical protein
LQPYWIKTFASQLFAIFVAYILRRYFANEYSNKLASLNTTRLIRLYNVLQVYTFVSIWLNMASSPSPSTSNDITRMYPYNNTLPTIASSWRVYEEGYLKYLGGGSNAFLLAGFNSLLEAQYEIDKNFGAYLSFQLTTKIGLVVSFMLPALLTHVIPSLVTFPYYSMTILSIIFLVRWIIDFILDTCIKNGKAQRKELSKKRSFSYRSISTFSYTMTAFGVTLLVETFFIYGILLYSLPITLSSLSTSEYLGIAVTEWKMRNTTCYLNLLIQSIQDFYNKGVVSIERLNEYISWLFVK